MEILKKLILTAIALAEKARREGLLSLEEEIDKLDSKNYNILKYGLRLSIDGADSEFISAVLTNIINQEEDKNILRIKTIQNEAVYCIYSGFNTRMLVMKLFSYLTKNECKSLETLLLNCDSDGSDLVLDVDFKTAPVKPDAKIVLKQSDFLKQTADILRIVYKFSLKARREGLLSLEDELEDIDHEILKEGLRLVVDGTDSVIISDIISNKINAQQDENYKRILTIQKHSILSIQAGYNAVFMLHKLISFLNNSELKNIKETLCKLDFFENNNFIDSVQFKREGKKFTDIAANIIQRAYKLSEVSYREGLLSMEDHIDQDKKAERDILEYGINFVTDGIDSNEIEEILSNQIDLEQNGEFKRLKLIQKAAVLCIFKGENPPLLIHTLLSFLNNKELEEIKKIYLKTDFNNKFNEILNSPCGTPEDIDKIQNQYAEETENAVTGREVIDFFNRPYDILEGADQTRLNDFIKQEHPQTAASLIAWLSSGCLTAGGIDTIVDIFKHTDRSVKKQIIDKWNEEDAELADEVKRRLFPFGNIVLLDDRAIQKVMREVDSQELAKAMKGTDAKIKDKIFYNMSKRAAAMLKEDMEYMGPVRKRDVEESQQKIVSIIRQLEYSGEIEIP